MDEILDSVKPQSSNEAVDISRPWGIETIDGQVVFDIFERDLIVGAVRPHFE